MAKYDNLKKWLEIWGEWYLKPEANIGYSTICMTGKIYKYGPDGARLNTTVRVYPNYFYHPRESRLNRLIHELPDNQKKAIRAKYLADRPLKGHQVAEILEISYDAYEWSIRQAYKNLSKNF